MLVKKCSFQIYPFKCGQGQQIDEDFSTRKPSLNLNQNYLFDHTL